MLIIEVTVLPTFARITFRPKEAKAQGRARASKNTHVKTGPHDDEQVQYEYCSFSRLLSRGIHCTKLTF